MDRWLQDHLVCPRDYNQLVLEARNLVCPSGHRYPFIDGIPIMLLEDVEVTHEACSMSLRQALESHPTYELDNVMADQNTVDSYVQHIIVDTCGNLYKPLIENLTRYPIPELCLEKGNGQYFLDIGCNWGRWCISAAKKGFIPIGIDPSLEAIRAARRVAQQLGVSATYIVADARYLPFAAKSFDVVFSYSVLQSFSKENVKHTLVGIKRVLKDLGTCLIQMANSYGLRSLYNQAKRGFKEPQKTAFRARYWTPGEMKSVFNSCIGPTSLFVDGYFSLNPQTSDLNLLPLRHRFVVYCSEMLRMTSKKIKWMMYFADSLYIKSNHLPN